MSLFVEFAKRIRRMVSAVNGLVAATLSADEAMPGPPLLPSMAKSKELHHWSQSAESRPRWTNSYVSMLCRYLPAPWSQIPALIETEAPGSMMQVPGGMITVALPKLGLAAEASAVS